MNPTNDWIKDWQDSSEPGLERRIPEQLIEIFQKFWIWANLESKSKSTQRRYSSALHALGGYLVEKAEACDQAPSTGQELLIAHITPEEGPLIHYENEAWQTELDTVCRKLHKYMDS